MRHGSPPDNQDKPKLFIPYHTGLLQMRNGSQFLTFTQFLRGITHDMCSWSCSTCLLTALFSARSSTIVITSPALATVLLDYDGDGGRSRVANQAIPFPTNCSRTWKRGFSISSKDDNSLARRRQWLDTRRQRGPVQPRKW